MVRGVGVDIVEVERIASALERRGDRFKARLFTDDEREYCESRPQPVLHYAARFAAKEAFSKAIGTGFTGGLSWKEIGIRHHPGGEPYLELSGRAAELLAVRGATKTHVSLSHSHTVSVAVVVIEDATP